MHVLAQACMGDARWAVESCSGMGPEKGYRMALEVLEKRYGDKYAYAVEVVEKMTSGPSVRADDGGALRKMADGIWAEVHSLEVMGMINEVDTSHTISNIAKRLKGRLREYYDMKEQDYKGQHGVYPKIKWVVKFLLDAAN